MAKQELLETIRDRYQAASRKEKSRIFDEFIAVTDHHRKHDWIERPAGHHRQPVGGRRETDLRDGGSGGRSGVASSRRIRVAVV